MADRKDTEKQPLTTNQASSGGHHGQSFFLRHITIISRLLGIVVLADAQERPNIFEALTVAEGATFVEGLLLWAATVTSLQGKTDASTYVGYYLLAASIVITFFEITWILDKLVCCVRQGCCCACWSIILWVDGWRKFILYVLLTVPLFLQGLKGVIDVVSGFCLLVLACVYLVKSFASIRDGRNGHEPIPDSKQITVTIVRHEMSTQTDVISVSSEPKEGALNPFETDDSDAEKPDNDEQEKKGRKGEADVSGEKSEKDQAASQ